MQNPSTHAPLVLRQDTDGIACLTLNRPDKLNALSVALFAELDRHVRDLTAQTDTIGCVLLIGAGKCFSAGHDLKGIAAGEAPPRPHFQAGVIEALTHLPQPVVTAVHGHCYTGGLELALAGDIILAANNARFADTHARWGLVPVWGGSQRLPRRVGQARAMLMMQTCRTVLADEALHIGLADQLLADDDFTVESLAFCRTLLANSWFSLRANKALLRQTEGMRLAEGLAHEIYRGSGRAPDHAERIAAFSARR